MPLLDRLKIPKETLINRSVSFVFQFVVSRKRRMVVILYFIEPLYSRFSRQLFIQSHNFKNTAFHVDSTLFEKER